MSGPGSILTSSSSGVPLISVVFDRCMAEQADIRSSCKSYLGRKQQGSETVCNNAIRVRERAIFFSESFCCAQVLVFAFLLAKGPVAPCRLFSETLLFLTGRVMIFPAIFVLILRAWGPAALVKWLIFTTFCMQIFLVSYFWNGNDET